MPSKLIFELTEMSDGGHIHLQHDGEPPVELRRVKRAVVIAEAGEPPMVKLTMHSPHFESEVIVSDLTAEAIVMHERQRQLAFLDDKDVGYLHELRATLVRVRGWPEDDLRLKPLDKILAELAKREEIPF